jgi:3D (Asp-Asp-Asp) domain-containing protein
MIIYIVIAIIVAIIIFLIPARSKADDTFQVLMMSVFNQPIEEGDNVYTAFVTVSAYTASEDECDSSPELTAHMTPSRIGTVAVSRDILKKLGLHLGQTIVLPTYGAFMIEDVMNERWKMRVDILHATKKAAKLFGVKYRVPMVWIDWDGRTLVFSKNMTLAEEE